MYPWSSGCWAPGKRSDRRQVTRKTPWQDAKWVNHGTGLVFLDHKHGISIIRDLVQPPPSLSRAGIADLRSGTVTVQLKIVPGRAMSYLETLLHLAFAPRGTLPAMCLSDLFSAYYLFLPRLNHSRSPLDARPEVFLSVPSFPTGVPSPLYRKIHGGVTPGRVCIAGKVWVTA